MSSFFPAVSIFQFPFRAAWLKAVLCFCACIAVLTSCSVDRHMAEKTDEMMKKMEATPMWSRLPVREVSWGQAFGMMMANNLDLKRTEQSMRLAERNVTKVFTQIIPGVNLDWMLTKELSELTRVSGKDVEYNTNILFNVPSLTQVPFDYYAAKASEYTAKKTLEMKKRELLSKLYRQVLLYQNAVSSYKHQLEEIPYDDDGVRRKMAEDEWRKKKDELAMAFGELLGNMDARWLVRPETMPRIDWNKYSAASRRLDLLVVTMVAMELEASRLQVMNAKMKFFPSMDVNFYSPSLFSGSGGTYQGFFAGAGDMKVNMSLREELDTRLDSWFQYKNARETYRIMQKKVHMDLVKRRIKIGNLMESRRRFLIWRKVTNNEIAFALSRPAVTGEEYLAQREELRKKYKELDSETSKNAEVEAALIMEYGWLQ